MIAYCHMWSGVEASAMVKRYFRVGNGFDFLPQEMDYVLPNLTINARR